MTTRQWTDVYLHIYFLSYFDVLFNYSTVYTVQWEKLAEPRDQANKYLQYILSL